MSQLTIVSNRSLYHEIHSTLESHSCHEVSTPTVIGEVHYFYLNKETQGFEIDNFRKRYGKIIDAAKDASWRVQVVKFIYTKTYEKKRWSGYVSPTMNEQLIKLMKKKGIDGESALVKMALNDFLKSNS